MRGFPLILASGTRLLARSHKCISGMICPEAPCSRAQPVAHSCPMAEAWCDNHIPQNGNRMAVPTLCRTYPISTMSPLAGVYRNYGDYLPEQFRPNLSAMAMWEDGNLAQP
jgi:hypothetical protein